MRVFFTALLVSCIAAANPAAAQDDLRREVRAAVEGTAERPGVLAALKSRDIKLISFGPFVWSSDKVPVTSGPGIAQAMALYLTAGGINISPKQDCVISAEFTPVENDNRSGAAMIKVVFSISCKGMPIATVTRSLFGPDIAWVELLNLTINPTATDDQKTAAINLARKDKAKVVSPEENKPSGPKPKDNKPGNKPIEPKPVDPKPLEPKPVTIMSSSDGRVALELYVAKAYEKEVPLNPKPEAFLPRQLISGSAFMITGEAYHIKIINNYDFTLAADLSIDGLSWSQFAQFDQKAPKPGEKEENSFYVVVKPKSSVIIRGWLKNLNKSMAFNVVDLPVESVSTKQELGVITIKYHACWEKNEQPPADEASVKHTLSGVKTGQGQEQVDNFKVVERTIGNFRGTLHLPYTRDDAKK